MKRTTDSSGNVEEELTPREARQGKPGWPVLYVLIGGLVLAGLVMAIIMFGANLLDTVPNEATKGGTSSITILSKAA